MVSYSHQMHLHFTIKIIINNTKIIINNRKIIINNSRIKLIIKILLY